jgi:hypothetical protein
MMDLMSTAQVLGNFGEFLGSIAVLATLIYLAVQVRQSKDLLEKNEKIALSQVYQARADARREVHLASMGDAVASIQSKLNVQHGFLGSADLEKLDELDGTERVQLANLLQASLTLIDSNEFQKSLGLLEQLADPEGERIVANLWRGLSERLGVRPPARVLIYWDEIANTG